MASMIRVWWLNLMVLALGVLGCSSPKPQVKCQPSNCNGCCDAKGACVAQDQQTFSLCGTGALGEACHACLPGQQCLGNRCSGAFLEDAGVVCGDLGEACCAGGTCSFGYECIARVCDDAQPVDASVGVCGHVGEACCQGSCFAPSVCTLGTCETPVVVDAGTVCGHLGEACCQGNCFTPLVCAGLTCSVFDAGVRLKPTGDPCTQSSECADGLCLTNGFPNGVCTKACTTSVDCIAGSQCARNPTGSGPAKVCLKQCTAPGVAPGGCRASWVCDSAAETSGIPVCFPACTSIATCAGAPTCDPRGFCCGAVSRACCEGTSCGSGGACSNAYCTTAACGGVGQACCTSGTACQGQTVCSGSSCVACGGVGQPCCAGSVCSGSALCQGTSCVACGAVGQACCSGSSCTGSSVCNGSSCVACGGVGQACCGGSTCSGSAVCQGTSCVACGAVGQACCSGGSCTGSSVCNGSSCVACGGLSQPCCVGNTCTSGTCTSGTCQQTSTKAPTGSACTLGTQCVGGTCITQAGALYPGGYCTQDCLLTSCAAGSGCSTSAVKTHSLCLAICTWDGAGGGCRSGYVCDRFAIDGSSTPACLSACTANSQCPTGHCENGFCCGSRNFRCCTGSTACTTGTCSSLGYCQ